MSNRQELLSAAAHTLSRAGDIALCGHVMPDGDCLGSMLALGLALRRMGKNVYLFSPDPVPNQYATLLPGAAGVAVEVPGEYAPEVFVSVDCSVPARLGRFKALMDSSKKIIIVDHHAGGFNFGHIYLNEPSAAAAGELVYELIDLLPVEMDADMAFCLYVAINTDTGSFRYDGVGSHTHRITARLLEKGIPAGYANKKIYEEKPRVCLQVLGEVLKTLDLSRCGRIAWMHLDRKTLHGLNARDEHADGVTNYPRMIEGVELALFFRQLEDGSYKVSFRSKYFLDVNKLASRFKGGGHLRAAGCVMNGELAEIKRQVVDAALIALEEEGTDERHD